MKRRGGGGRRGQREYVSLGAIAGNDQNQAVYVGGWGGLFCQYVKKMLGAERDGWACRVARPSKTTDRVHGSVGGWSGRPTGALILLGFFAHGNVAQKKEVPEPLLGVWPDV